MLFVTYINKDVTEVLQLKNVLSNISKQISSNSFVSWKSWDES